MSKPRALDLFCKAGGATKGLQRAGFHVTGVDIEPQPRYCGDEFICADALSFDLLRFDFIWASPKCQFNLHGLNASNVAQGRTIKHENQIPIIRQRLIESGLPYIIENIKGSPLVNPVTLCGSMFGLQVRRHRLFESNVLLFVPHCNHSIWKEAKYPTNFRPDGKIVKSKVVQVYGNTAGAHLWPNAMGIDWMKSFELSQAIPPAYSEYLGKQIINYLERIKLAA